MAKINSLWWGVGGVALAAGAAAYYLIGRYVPEEHFQEVVEPDLAGDGATTYATQGEVTGAALLQSAEKYAGVPYVFGKASREDGFDCSSLIQRAAADLGLQIPRLASNQYLACANAGLLIDEARARATPGALVFFYDQNASSAENRSRAFHVAMSTGDGRVFEAQGNGTNVGYYDWGWWNGWFAKKAKAEQPKAYGVRFGLLPNVNYG